MRKRNYYYLVSGLPELIIDDKRQNISFRDIVNDFLEQIDARDVELINTLRYPFDNKNVVTILEKKDREFDNRGVYSKDELEELLKYPDELPSYLSLFISDYKDNKLKWQGLLTDDIIAAYYYEWTQQHYDSFVKDYFKFDRDLRNVLAAVSLRYLSQREVSVDKENKIITGNSVADALIRSNAPDFGLEKELPWINSVISLDYSDPVQFEKGIDELRWDILSELTVFSYFNTDTLMAFLIKVLIVERWNKLDPEYGEQVFNKLIDEIYKETDFEEKLK